ncbi:autotransporter outer membrane beta-barrel domain-containing protein [Phenylobacterium sp. LjRoot164]|uniref:autotransporter outer membrane beta-barrel domain-containing protein n=1 Tax=unclassified Phenylobacterium TaxID=2640670 RepID=UPI003ECE213D
MTASVLALSAVVPAQAANFTAGTEQQFRDALAAAAASADAQSTILLTAGFAVAAPISFPDKQIVVDPAGFTVTGLTFNGAAGSLSVSGAGTIPLAGANTLTNFSVSNGEARLLGGATLNVSGLTNIASTGKLVIDGAGTLLTTGTLSAANPGVTPVIDIQNGGRLHATAGTGIGGLGNTGALELRVTGAGSRLDIEGATATTFGGSTTTASWTIADRGASTIAGGLIIGSQTSGSSTPQLTVTDASSILNLGGLTFWRGTFSVLGGGQVNISGSVGMGPRIGAGSANLLISGPGSRFVVNGPMSLGANAPGSNGAGFLTLADGGVLEARGGVTLGANFAATTGVLNIGGVEGGAAAAAGTLDTATLAFGPGTGRLNFNHTGTNYEFVAAITGGGTINQVAGVTHLTGDSSGFTGVANLTGGTLHVDGKLGAATSTFAVGAGGVLAGSGTIGGDVTVTGGRIAPGNSPGTLTIAGDLSLDAATTLDMEFGESNVVGGPMNDLIKVGGDLRLDGTVNVTVTAGGVFDAGLYRIMSYSGTLDNQGLSVGATPAGSTVTVQTLIPGQVNLVNTAGQPVNFWDGDGAGSANNGRVEGGAGTWTTASTNWTTGTGAVNTAYAATDFLIFAGAPGTVNVGAVNLTGGTGHGLQFAVDGYRLTGGTIAMTGSGRTIRVGDGTADGANYVATIDTPISGGGAGFTKTDLGTLILNGANTFNQVMTIQAGTVLLNGSVAGGGNALIVQANGTFGGTGTSRGGAISGTLAPGGLTNPGTLTFNGPLSLNASAVLRYRLGQADTVGGALNDLTVVNGALTLNGTLNVTQSTGGSFLQGVYRLINYTGVLTDNILDVGTLPAGFTGVIQTSIANQVNLIASGAPPAGPGGGGEPPAPPPTFNFWDGAGGADGAITGGDGVWSASPANWTTASGAANGAFTTDAFAIFAGTAGTVTVDGSEGPIAVTGLQFASDGYRLTGDAVTLQAGDNVVRVGDGTSEGATFVATIASELTGAGLLNKEDGGALILTGENSYSGGTTVSAGVLQIGDGGKTGSIWGDVSNGGTLAFKRSDDVSFGGAVSGDGTLAQLGAGVLSLTGDSSAFAGVTEVRAGTLAIDGQLGGVTNVLSGARLIGSGQLGGLVNQTGGVASPGRGGVGVLTVAGDYVGAGGVLELDATLADDSASADRLVVRGATSGVTGVKINRLAGGTGALTRDGILLVQVDGASAPGAFALAQGDYRRGDENVLVAGAYGYVLRRDAVGGDWRLRSNLEPSEIPGAPADAPLYQPGAPIYEAYPQALQLLNGLGTMRERTGARQWSGEAGVGVWGRMEGGRTQLKPDASTTRADLKADRWKLQFGVEPLVGEAAGGVISAGLTGYLGGAKTKVASPYGGGDIDTKGYGLGANLTWIAAGGGYVDAQLQASWFDSDLSSNLLGARADGIEGDGLSASLEAGHGFAAGGLRLTPQAQVTYAGVDFDSFTDGFGAVVANDKSESLIARAGLGVDYALAAGGGVYAVVDLSHEFLDGTAIDVSGVPVVSRGERTWAGLAAGGTYGWGDGRYSVYGEIAGDTSLSSFGDSYDITGAAGFRVRF